MLLGLGRIALGLMERVRRAFRSDRAEAPAAGPVRVTHGEALTPRSVSVPENASAAAERIAVRNAGLELAAPFLPQLFDRLGLIEPGEAGGPPRWVGAAQARAPHLLQFLVDGSCDSPGPLLALNKLLCGLPPGTEVPPAIDPTAEEMALCNSLLDAMIASWPTMNGSSVAALQETFLQREGFLVATEGAWRLQVERKTLDVLMEGLPWSFSTISHRWMTHPVSVEW